jgi:cytochrome c peroxidase
MKRFFSIIALAAFTLTCCAQNNLKLGESKVFDATNGRKLFLKNCAHCHGADASGDEGPDLHRLDWTDEQNHRAHPQRQGRPDDRVRGKTVAGRNQRAYRVCATLK